MHWSKAPVRWLVSLAVVATACASGSTPANETPSPTNTAADSSPVATTPPESDSPLTVEPDQSNAGGGAEPEHSDAGGAAEPAQFAELEWNVCGAGVECAALDVPLDWSDPDGVRLLLAVIRRPATNGNALGSLILNPGGPGGSGVSWLAASTPVPSEVAAVFDLVSWDPRGVGDSGALACEGPLLDFYQLDSSPDNPAEQTALNNAASQAAAACEANGIDTISHIGLAATVADMEALRGALGDQPMRYVGFSYGTFLGLGYLEAYPDKVEAMVLDGVVDPSLSRAEFLRDQTIAFDAVLSDLVATCAGRAPCSVAGDLDNLVNDLMATAEAEPVELANGTTLEPAAVADAITASLYSPTGQTRLVDALGRWAGGDAGGIAALATSYLAFTGWSAYTAVSCIDSGGIDTPEAALVLADELAALSPLLGAAFANELLPCAFWPVAATPPQPIVGIDAAPVVLIGGTHDPATPLHWAESVHEQLGTAGLIVFDGQGHTAIGRSQCVDNAVAAYLIDGVLPDAGLVCR